MEGKVIALIEEPESEQVIELGLDQAGWLYMSINGSLQFYERDEYRYHQVLFLLPYLLCSEGEPKVLILGGGDGLGARELLKAGVQGKNITLVDISRAVLFLASSSPLRELNEGSIERVNVVEEDAFTFVKRAIEMNETWDIVILDYPDPREAGSQVNRLFSEEHLSDVKKVLRKEGVVSLQATSPFSFPNTFKKLLFVAQKIFNHVLPLKVDMSIQYQLGALILSDSELVLRKKIPEWCFFSEETLGGLMVFFRDEVGDLSQEELETLKIEEVVRYDVEGRYESGRVFHTRPPA